MYFSTAICGEAAENVDQLLYPGSHLSSKANAEEEMQHQRGSARDTSVDYKNGYSKIAAFIFQTRVNDILDTWDPQIAV